MSMTRLGGVGKCILGAVLVAVLMSAGGCGYLRNVGDDIRDCVILGVGITPAVFRDAYGELEAGGVFPPSLGFYIEATDLLHFGALAKVSADFDWDRRAYGIVTDRRAKLGFGPAHYIRISQTPILVNGQPLLANAYKQEGTEMDGWRDHMRMLEDPLFHRPAKELIFTDNATPLPRPHRGWQNFLTVSAEVAISEPFITHCGVNARVGFSICEVFDLALSVLAMDWLYYDNAYEFWTGVPIHGGFGPDEKPPSLIERIMGTDEGP